MSDVRTHSSVEEVLGRLREARTLAATLARASVGHNLFGEPGEAVRLGRFMLLERIGVGAMGVVYAAYDPELDRRVALKVLRERGDSPEARELGAQRLLREAKAMARLDHPNVVRVFEVGRHEELTFVAMEQVEGTTLRQWLETKRPVAEVLAMFVAAGRGLAAAHRAGLIHRDFKPENVLVDGEGRPRVADFGVARLAEDLDRVSATISPTSPMITRTGALVGTPAYMAPEQLEANEADARSDQFSFCVALWEALFGRRPFSGESVEAIALAIEAGPPPPPASAPRVPARVVQAIRRGLAHDPAKRWPDVDALLRELAPPDRGPLGSFGLWGLALVLLGGGAGMLVLRSSSPCADVGERMDSVWNDEARERVAASIGGAGDWGASMASSVTDTIDEYGAGWREARRDTCEATHVRHEQSEHRLDLRMSCLDQRLDELEAVVQLLATADVETAARADQAVDRLIPTHACEDLERLESRMPLPEDPNTRAAIEDLTPRISAIKANLDAGNRTRAAADAQTLQAEAASVLESYPPLQAELLGYEGVAFGEMRQWERAQAALEASAHAALAGGDRVQARDAWIWLARVEGSKRTDPARGRTWLGLARAELEHHPDPAASVFADESEAAIALSEGNPKRAVELMESVVEARNRQPSARDRLKSWTNLANALHAAGEYEKATDRHRAAVTLAQHELGTDHPDVAAHLGRLGDSLQHAGHLEEARQTYERALALADRAADDSAIPRWSIHKGLATIASSQDRLEDAIAEGEKAVAAARESASVDQTPIAFSEVILGQAYVRAGKSERAAEVLEEAVTILESQLGADHPHVGTVTGVLADVQYRNRRYEQALEMYEQSLQISEAKLGPDHPRLGFHLIGIGQSLNALDRSSEAIPRLERAVAVRERAQGPDSPTLVLPLIELARAHVAVGRASEAEKAARRALALRDETASPIYRAYAEWQLAKALDGLGRRGQARTLAREALEVFEQEAEAEKERDEVREFLAG